ncbi:hypothetical protein V6N11_021774 [Hibiscus sabdariffa]|uniref:non-specific serine/threonine protein kinase n=1 Tax=Hibiscus sabdariffa TaxID=183260 RepID=A0ABR2TI18_9ROSI
MIFLCFRLNRNARKRKVKHILGLISYSLVSKEILQIKALNQNVNCFSKEVKIGNVVPSKSSEEVSDDVLGVSDVSSADAQNIGWGRWYNMKELEMATHGFAEENVVGEGGYGVVFCDVLQHGSISTVKIFLNNKKRRMFVLVYELMKNSSVQDALLDRKCEELMGWSRRLKTEDLVEGLEKGVSRKKDLVEDNWSILEEIESVLSGFEEGARLMVADSHRSPESFVLRVLDSEESHAWSPET